MYGFVYITTNHVNGKQYIGQRKYDKQGKWKEYLGSGIILSRAIEKYGIEVAQTCDTAGGSTSADIAVKHHAIHSI